MAKYQHIENNQTRNMSKEEHKNLPDSIRNKWKELPSVAKKKIGKEVESKKDEAE